MPNRLFDKPILSISAQQVTTEPPQQTHAPADARYEMIQSSLAAKFTVKLDSIRVMDGKLLPDQIVR
jgi:hypothetical protein